MRFHLASYRHGVELLGTIGAIDEILAAVESITLAAIDQRRSERQVAENHRAVGSGGRPRKAGIQDGLNAELVRLLTHPDRAWRSQAPLFHSDSETGKGYWTMDFHKFFPQDFGVGVEVTFNHAEALPWTLIRPSLAYLSDEVLPETRVEAGAIIIGTDHLKGNRRDVGGLRMDSAVGTYERLLALLPRLKWVVPVPLVILGLDWADGGKVGSPVRVNLHGQTSATVRTVDE